MIYLSTTPLAKGARGADGKSPYEVAVENGYTGTEVQFNTELKNMLSKNNPAVLGTLTKNGNTVPSEITSDSQPSGQVTGDYWYEDLII